MATNPDKTSNAEAKKASPLLASQFQLALLQFVESANSKKQTTLTFPLSTATGERNHDVAKLLSLLPRPTKPLPSVKIPSKKKVLKKTEATAKKHSIYTIPYNRVRMLMKTAPNVTNLSQEAIAMTAKAAELFITKVTRDSYSTCKTAMPFSNEVQYNHLAQSVRKSPQQMTFLFDFLPFKVKARDYLSQIENKTDSSENNAT